MKTTSILLVHWLGVGRFGQRTKEIMGWPSTKSEERRIDTWATVQKETGALVITQHGDGVKSYPGENGRTIRTYAPGTWLYFEEVEPNEGNWMELLKDLTTPGNAQKT